MGTKWYQSKTVWTGIAGVLTAASGYFTGTFVLADAIQTGLISFIGIFMRTGIAREINR